MSARLPFNLIIMDSYFIAQRRRTEDDRKRDSVYK